MDDHHSEDAESGRLSSTPEALFDRYGHHLDDPDEPPLSEAQKMQILVPLWIFMAGCVEHGLSLKSGDNFGANFDCGIDDVLSSLEAKLALRDADVSPITNNKEQNT
ncbi:MAG: hypothetical protein AAFR47_15395 [Pseudomonadota bacterium]